MDLSNKNVIFEYLKMLIDPIKHQKDLYQIADFLKDSNYLLPKKECNQVDDLDALFKELEKKNENIE